MSCTVLPGMTRLLGPLLNGGSPLVIIDSFKRSALLLLLLFLLVMQHTNSDGRIDPTSTASLHHVFFSLKWTREHWTCPICHSIPLTLLSVPCRCVWSFFCFLDFLFTLPSVASTGASTCSATSISGSATSISGSSLYLLAASKLRTVKTTSNAESWQTKSREQTLRNPSINLHVGKSTQPKWTNISSTKTHANKNTLRLGHMTTPEFSVPRFLFLFGLDLQRSQLPLLPLYCDDGDSLWQLIPQEISTCAVSRALRQFMTAITAF